MYEWIDVSVEEVFLACMTIWDGEAIYLLRNARWGMYERDCRIDWFGSELDSLLGYTPNSYP